MRRRARRAQPREGGGDPDRPPASRRTRRQVASADGAALQLEVQVAQGDPIGPVLAQQLQAAGFDAVFRVDAGRADRRAGRRHLQQTSSPHCGSLYDPWQTLEHFHSKYAAPAGQAAKNLRAITRYGNPELDAHRSTDGGAPALADRRRLHGAGAAGDGDRARDLPQISLTEEMHPQPFNTTYWTGWPAGESLRRAVPVGGLRARHRTACSRPVMARSIAGGGSPPWRRVLFSDPGGEQWSRSRKSAPSRSERPGRRAGGTRATSRAARPGPRTPRSPGRCRATRASRSCARLAADGAVGCLVTADDGSWGFGVSRYGTPVIALINDHLGPLLVGRAGARDRAAVGHDDAHGLALRRRRASPPTRSAPSTSRCGTSRARCSAGRSTSWSAGRRATQHRLLRHRQRHRLAHGARLPRTKLACPHGTGRRARRRSTPTRRWSRGRAS